MATTKNKNKNTNSQDVLIVMREKGVNAKGFGHVAKYIMTDWDLDLGSKSLYSYLSSAAGSGEEAYMRRSRILAEMNMSEETYLKYMTALQNRGYIIRAQSRTPGGVFGTTVIEFVMIPAHLAGKIQEAQEAETKPTMYSGTIYALGYGIMPRLVARDVRLSYKARGLYAYYSVFANNNGEAFPSREAILKDLNISKNTYTKLLKELTTYGYLTVKQAHDKDGKMGKSFVRLNMFPEAVLAKNAEDETANSEKTATNAPCPKKPGTVKNAPCPKKPGTVEEVPCTKKPGTVEAPCTNFPCPAEPCPEKPGTVFNINNTNPLTITNLSLIDRLMDSVRERIHYGILLFAYEREPQALEAINIMLDAIQHVFSTTNPRIQIGNEMLYTQTVSEVLMQINNDATVAVIERYLAHSDTVYNPASYLLASIYREILNPTDLEQASEM